MRQLIYTMFISNNHASFHLWSGENLVKYKKVSKYYENYFRLLPTYFTSNSSLFNHDLNRSSLVYMFSLRFSGSRFLINFSYTSFCWACNVFILCLKLLFRKYVTCVLGCSFIKTFAIKGC